LELTLTVQLKFKISVFGMQESGRRGRKHLRREIQSFASESGAARGKKMEIRFALFF
jgi:hypothetical protein